MTRSTVPLVFRAVREDAPGSKWKALFDAGWPAYQKWFQKEGDSARPSYGASLRMLRAHMPELIPTYERLLELAGGGDLVSRFLSLYRPAPYLTACSQVVWPGDDPVLIRNYDYSPELFEATLLSTAWNGRRVIAMSDCIWGVLDGCNEAGLALSLSFGGRPVVGDGFGIPLVLRYILEFCDGTEAATAVLRRVPVHMAYNVTILDARGDYVTVYVSPDRGPVVRRWPVATNHQGRVEWTEFARASTSVEREHFLSSRLSDPSETAAGLVEAFLRPPLFCQDFARGWGTLYTAVYRPTRGQAEYRWPAHTWRQSIGNFTEQGLAMHYDSRAPSAG